MLYDTRGDGLHEYAEAECIQRARRIRLVLGQFAHRANDVLAEDREFSETVGTLAGRSDAPKSA